MVQGRQLELWANLSMVGFGLLLMLAALMVRTRVPGGLPFAGAALLALQALDVHNAAHLETTINAQLLRAVASAVLMLMAFVGGLPSRSGGKERARPRPAPDEQVG